MLVATKANGTPLPCSTQYQTLLDLYSTVSMLVLMVVVVQNCVVGPLGSPVAERAPFAMELAVTLVDALTLVGLRWDRVRGTFVSSLSSTEAVVSMDLGDDLDDYFMLQHASFMLFWIVWGGFNLYCVGKFLLLREQARCYMSDKPTAECGNGEVMRDSDSGRITSSWSTASQNGRSRQNCTLL